MILAAEALRECRNEPYPVVRNARILKHVLENMDVAVRDDDLLLGCHPKQDYPEEKRAQAWEILSHLPPAPGMEGHMVIDFETILRRGLADIRAEVEQRLAAVPPTSTDASLKRAFYRAAGLSLDSAITFIRRYADLAKKASAAASSKVRSKELAEWAELCDKVATQPAETFKEAIQLAWFAYLLVCVENGPSHACFCPGRMDRYLLPYYERDTRAGRLSREAALELLCDYYAKTNEFANDAPVVVMAGGQWPNGDDATSELSYLLVEASDLIGLVNPSFAVSWHRKMPDDFKEACGRLLRNGKGYPAFFNDEVIIPGLLRYGVTRQDACEYVPCCCVELTISGKSNPWVASDYINTAQCLLDALDDGAATYDALYADFKRRLADAIARNTERMNELQIIKSMHRPFPLLSAFVSDCLEKGLDITSGGARYNFIEPEGVGIPNVADSLFNIKQFVFDKKQLSLEELKDALKKNFEGAEQLRLRLFNNRFAYGNDIDEVDRIAADIFDFFLAESEKYRTPFGGVYGGGFLCWRMHYELGKHTGATPDGRKATLPLADSIGAVQGKARSGPTALVKSATKFDQSRALGGLALNLKFTPQSISSHDGLRKMLAVLDTYFQRGGFETQINIVGRATLLDAQKHPDQHRDLIVRVAGYSAYFTSLEKPLQDEIIQRSEHSV